MPKATSGANSAWLPSQPTPASWPWHADARQGSTMMKTGFRFPRFGRARKTADGRDASDTALLETLLPDDFGEAIGAPIGGGGEPGMSSGGSQRSTRDKRRVTPPARR